MSVEKLIKRCDECEEHECIQCEICWSDVQEIKKLFQLLEEKTKIGLAGHAYGRKMEIRVISLEQCLKKIREYIVKDIQECTYRQISKYQEILKIIEDGLNSNGKND